MKIFNSIKKLKKFFILIVPDHSLSREKSRRFSMSGAAVVLLSYTIVIAIFGFIIFTITPLGNLIIDSKVLTDEELNKLDEFNNRMLLLSKELESLKSTNERLKYAIMLGDSTLLESLKVNYDTTATKNKTGGSILSVIRKLFFKSRDNQFESYYFLKPVDGFVSREFNPDKGHYGIDFVAKTGTPVYAAADGYILFSDYTSKDGYMIIIAHPGNYVSVYKHCSVLVKKMRETVQQGELIALSGNTGDATTGPHLHFEIWFKGQPQDPKNLFYN